MSVFRDVIHTISNETLCIAFVSGSHKAFKQNNLLLKLKNPYYITIISKRNETSANRFWDKCKNPFMALYRVSQEEWTKLRESIPYVELYRYNSKHLYPKLNG